MSMFQIERSMANSTSAKVIEVPYRINVINIKTNINKITNVEENNNISHEEEKDYYKKTLKSKFV